jgi:hypothetical protein
VRSLEDIQEGKQCGRATGRDVSQRETKSKLDTGLPHEVGPLKSLGEDRGEEGRYARRLLRDGRHTNRVGLRVHASLTPEVRR